MQAKYSILPCPICGRAFRSKASDRSRGGGKFCSRVCYAQAQMLPVDDRFWSQVQKTETCWLWTGYKDSKGYGRMSVQGHVVPVHRLSYEMVNGPIPDGLFALHRCDTPACCRPDHIFLGTQLENMQDMADKGRRPVGEQVKSAKLRPSDVLAIRRRCAGGEPQRSLSVEYGVDPMTIHHIVKRKTWRHLSDDAHEPVL